MVNSLTFTAQTRTLLGKKSHNLLKQRQLPANIYGTGIESTAITLDLGTFARLYTHASDNALIYLTLDKETKPRPVLIEEVSVNSVTGDMIHVVFKQVNLSVKVEAEIPVELVGEFKLPDAVIVTVKQIIEVEALPTDLPEKFVVDISKLTAIDQSFTYADLDYDKSKVTLMISEEEMNDPIVMVQAVKEQVEEVVEVAPTDAAATPAAGAPAAEAPAAANKGEKKAA